MGNNEVHQNVKNHEPKKVLKHLSTFPISQDPLRDLLSQDLAEPFRAATLAFPAIRDKATFHEGGGAFRLFKHLEALRLEPPISRDEAPTQLALDVAGQFPSLCAARPVEGLSPTDTAVGVGIEMQADKDGFCRGIGHFRPVFQRNELVCGSGQSCCDALAGQDSLKPVGQIQGEIFLHQAIGMRPRILTAMAGINHHVGKRLQREGGN